jgi:hypothetical protein
VHADRRVKVCMNERGIPRFVMAYAVIVALLLIPPLLGA